MTRREISRCKTIATDRDDYSSSAAAVIISGGIVAIPTETSYGLAVDPFNSHSLERLFDSKRRPSTKPVLVLIDGIDQLSRLILAVPNPFKPLMQRFWPGPLTLIFPALPTLPSLLTAGTGTIGVRISSNLAATEICRKAGGVITATSANISGEMPARTTAEIEQSFGDSVDLIVDDGDLARVPPSTILTYRDNRVVEVRKGSIAYENLKAPGPHDS